MTLLRLLIQFLLLPTLALIVPLLYAIAWLREARADLARRPVPVRIHRQPHGLERRRP